MTASLPSALLVSDAPGHIVERIGRSWCLHGRGVHYELLATGSHSSFAICQRASQLGAVHWLDQIAFQVLGKAVRAPQVAMVHHLTDDCLAQGIAALEHCDAITTTSKHWQSKLEALTGRSVVCLPYTVDTRTFRPPADREAARMAAGIRPGQFVIGFVGKAGANYANRKGIDVFQTILRNAAQRWRNLSVLLVGPGWESLASQIQRSGVRVLRQEYETTEQTVAAYALMDALLVTSTEEGGPCTILEAMACGVPVITSVVGHVSEVVRNGETGLICPSRDPREYLEHLDHLRNSSGLRRRLTTQAREFVVVEREDGVVIPRMDFASLYAGAIARFRTRPRLERAIRTLPLSYLYARSLARPLRQAMGWS
jgi:glycosyltransferase involved in cell wall biosynthesis